MGFYEELSKYYDIVFPVTNDKVSFVHNKSINKSRILDVACGTGGYSISLSKLGHTVHGIDLDKEMIESAIRKARNEGLDIYFRHGDMKDIFNIFKENKYDTIFCIGNSLVHLNSELEIEQFIHDTYKMLNDNGKAIIQIVNYDRILDFGVDYLPTIIRDEERLKFIRKYEYNNDSNKIYFNTELSIEKDNNVEKYVNSVLLLPLRSNVLAKMLMDAGFKEVDMYGSFNEDKHIIQSFATIAVASK